MNIAEVLRLSVLKNICEQLPLSDVISTQSIYNLAFAQPICLKFLFHNENLKIISKIVTIANLKEQQQQQQQQQKTKK